MKKKNATIQPPVQVMTASAQTGGLRGIEDIDPRVTVVKEAASVIPFVIKTVIIGGIVYFVYRSYTNRFVKLKENNNYPVANISMAQAKTRADAIYGSIGWFSNSFDTVADNMAGLNYNGFVRLYNAFGHHTGTFFSGDLNLVEWIKNQFDEQEVQSLSLLNNGTFFRQYPDKVNRFFDALNGMNKYEKGAFLNLLLQWN